MQAEQERDANEGRASSAEAESNEEGPEKVVDIMRAIDRAKRAVKDQERQLILQVLEECAWNQSRAADRLGISRRTLVNRLDAYSLPRPRKPRK